MSTIIPEGEALKNAIKWISSRLEEMGVAYPPSNLISEAILKYDLSPKDSEFLITFYKSCKSEGGGNK